jgi:hypothetical protein
VPARSCHNGTHAGWCPLRHVRYLVRLLERAGLMARLPGPREVLVGLERLVRLEQALLAGAAQGGGAGSAAAGGAGGEVPLWLSLGSVAGGAAGAAGAEGVVERLLRAAVVGT